MLGATATIRGDIENGVWSKMADRVTDLGSQLSLAEFLRIFEQSDSTPSHGVWVWSTDQRLALVIFGLGPIDLNAGLRGLWCCLAVQLESVDALRRQLQESAVRIEVAVKETRLTREAAREVDQLKTRFLANMSHELRTPLNGIIGMAGLLDRGALNVEQNDIVTTIENCAESLLVIINGVLDFAKLDAGRVELTPTEFDLNELFEVVLDLFHERARTKGLDLAVEFMRFDAPRLVGDAGRLRQILVNLVGNAVKFTLAGSVRLWAGLRGHSSDHIELTVHVVDTGIGVPPEFRGQLFQPFNQLSAELAAGPTGGTGLGLAISRQLVELMGGEIGLNETSTGGSDFWFTVPLKVGAAPSQPLGHRFVRITDALLVQAPSFASEALLRLLVDMNLRVSRETTFAAAADWLRRQDGTVPGVVALVDISHPEGCGLDFVLGLAASEGRRLPPTVLLSERGDTLDPTALQESGLAACLPKPIKPSRLLACLKSIDERLGSQRSSDVIAPGDTAHFRRLHGLGTQRVLLVEDNPVNQKLALQLLNRLGFCADPVGNGLEAVEALKRVHYPVVLMDCQMPVMDGWEATRLIRRLESQEFWGQDARGSYIIGLVNGQQDGDFEACQKVGMDDCITKPLRKDDLKVIMAQAVERVRSMNGESSVKANSAAIFAS